MALCPPLPSSATNGPIFLEAVVQCICQGVIFAQAARYLGTYPKDSARMKVFVGILVLLSALQTAVSIYKAYFVSILLEPWGSSPLKWIGVILNGLISVICEIFLIRRCWKAAKKSYWILAPLCLLALTIFISVTFLNIDVGKNTDNPSVTDPLKSTLKHSLPAVYAFSYWIYASLALDTAITAILLVYLWRSRTGLQHLDKAVKYIIDITWQSAAVPFVLEIVGAGLYHAGPRVNYQLVFLFVLSTGKFYTLGILRTINSRTEMRQRIVSSDLGRRSLHDWQWNNDNTPVQAAPVQISPTALEEGRLPLSTSEVPPEAEQTLLRADLSDVALPLQSPRAMTPASREHRDSDTTLVDEMAQIDPQTKLHAAEGHDPEKRDGVSSPDCEKPPQSCITGDAERTDE